MVKFRKYIAYVTSFMTAWPGGQFQQKYRLRHILDDIMAWWLISEHILAEVTSFMTALPGG